jgi:hypothetical protein
LNTRAIEAATATAIISINNYGKTTQTLIVVVVLKNTIRKLFELMLIGFMRCGPLQRLSNRVTIHKRFQLRYFSLVFETTVQLLHLQSMQSVAVSIRTIIGNTTRATERTATRTTMSVFAFAFVMSIIMSMMTMMTKMTILIIMIMMTAAKMSRLMFLTLTAMLALLLFGLVLI